MSEQTAHPSPGLFFDTITAYQRSAALKAAIDLEFFTAIGEGNATVPQIAERCAASERGTRILCDNLAIQGFLTKVDSRYALTPDSAAFLDKRSPMYMGSAAGFLFSPMLAEGFKDLTPVVRSGRTSMQEQGTVTPDHPVWVDFARCMAPMMALPAQLIVKEVGGDPNRKMKILDIAAGHGLFGIAFAKAFPNAEVVAQDWENVLQVAQENAQSAGVCDRYCTIPGNAFEVDFGTGYDLVLLTNFLHHFDPPTNETLLRKVHASLAEGGQAVALEFIPNPDRVTPPPTASFSLIMLGSTPSGDAYTYAELDSMFINAGFSGTEFRALPPTVQQIVIAQG
jgi:hypothetical protein